MVIHEFKTIVTILNGLYTVIHESNTNHSALKVYSLTPSNETESGYWCPSTKCKNGDSASQINSLYKHPVNAGHCRVHNAEKEQFAEWFLKIN